MDLHAQLAPIAAEAARTGIACLPEWLTYQNWSWWDDHCDYPASDDAARMIAEAGLARMLAERACAVYYSSDPGFKGWKFRRRKFVTGLRDARDYFAALVAATLKVYATLPDAAKPTPATAAREEGER